ncbi:hypothetical protein CCR75_005501 [Bremia lactucae]|uniref:Uncharacterized protein n=1 Tax=Bremia lactucae TaxID=4779 RepID=A0A976IJD5_BRELC|nr:hypothetical protein CCR75_005501 [Bremia lactucae]
MLAEVACRWLGSLPRAQRLSRPLQLHVFSKPQEDKDGAVWLKPRSVSYAANNTHEDEPRSQNVHLSLHKSTSDDLMAVAERSCNENLSVAQDLTLPADSEMVKFKSLVLSGSVSKEDMDRARKSLQTLKEDLENPRAAVLNEIAFQRVRRQLKAATGKLDRMLYAMRQRRDYAQVEAVLSVWEEEFPQFSSQSKHWSVLSEHYALALNNQQRFEDVVNKFSNYLTENDEESLTEKCLSVLTPRLAQSIFVALGHLRDGFGVLRLLDTMQRHDVHVTKVSYFHVLNALLHDQNFTDFEKVLQLCEEMTTNLPGENVPLSLLPMIMMTAAACGESERAMKLYNHPPDLPMTSFTENRFEMCLQQLNRLGEDSMLMEMYRNLLLSAHATRGVKDRVSKYLFKVRVAETSNKDFCVAWEILRLMNLHKILVSHHAIYPLMYKLFSGPLILGSIDGGVTIENGGDVPARIESADDLCNFFERFSCSLMWNEFALCEAIIAGVRADRAGLVDSLCVYALENNMPIKYAALEQVVVYYYRLGFVNDFERVSTMVRALRLNKDIPVGIAVTEVGMAANFRLNRYDEVIMLFEDFASIDGERRRALKRPFMLQTALNAYKHLGRGDEAMAIQELLIQFHSTSPDNSIEETLSFKEEEATVEVDGERGNVLNHGRNSVDIGEQEQLVMLRLDRYSSSKQ